MARYMTHPAARSLVAGGVIAGIIGAVLMHGFLFAVGMAHFPATYEWIASAFLPHATGERAVWFGIGMHFAIAIVAATLYAYAAQVTGLMGRPLLGGLIFGIVTNGVMDVLVHARGLAPFPTTWHDIGLGLVAHVVFFGVPVALYLSRYERVPIPWV